MIPCQYCCSMIIRLAVYLLSSKILFRGASLRCQQTLPCDCRLSAFQSPSITDGDHFIIHEHEILLHPLFRNFPRVVVERVFSHDLECIPHSTKGIKDVVFP